MSRGSDRRSDHWTPIADLSFCRPPRPVIISICTHRFEGAGVCLPTGGSAVRAGVAQLVEHLICNQRVGGSNPSASSAKIFRVRGNSQLIAGGGFLHREASVKVSLCLYKLRACTAAFFAQNSPRADGWVSG